MSVHRGGGRKGRGASQIVNSTWDSAPLLLETRLENHEKKEKERREKRWYSHTLHQKPFFRFF